MGRSFDKGMLLGIGLVVTVLVLTAALTFLNIERLNEDAGWVAHTHDVLDMTSDVLLTLVDAETGERGFIITGKDEFLQPYGAALARFNERMAILKEKTKDNATQQSLIKKLEELAVMRLALLEEAIALRRQGERQAQEFLLAKKGKAQMDELRELVAAMRREEMTLLKDRERQSQGAYQTAILTTLGTALVGLMMVTAFVWLLERNLRSRQRAAAAIREQREWLRVTLASIGDAVITTDTAGLVTYLNPVAQTLTGWGLDEARGQSLDTVFPILHERTRQPVENPVVKVLREGVVVGLGNHTVLIARDGAERPIDDSAAPIRGDNGSTVGVVLIFRDVTQQRRAQAALRESEARKAAVLNTAVDAIITMDHLGNIIEFNPAAERIFGYRRTDVLNKEMAELIIPPSLRDSHRRGLAHYLATGVGPVLNKRLELTALRSDGSAFPVELAITRISAEGPPLFTGYLRDISERRRAEQAAQFLADASKSLAALVDYGSTLQKVARLAVPFFADWCAVDKVEADGSVNRVAVVQADQNEPASTEERSSLDPTPALGLANVLRTGRAEMLTDVPDATLVGSAHEQERLRILRELGLKSYMCVPLAVRGKTVAVMTFADAASGRRFDAGDLALAEELAHRAGIAMENAQLYSEVREADRRKDEFLAMLAHELRNPLAPIRNALHIMKQPQADGGVVERMREMMERQVQHMTRMVDDLLDVSRITRGKIELRKEIVDLAVVVSRTVEATRPLLDDRRQELSVSLPPGPMPLEADPTRLEQVLANLLNNAAKYTDQGGHIWLSAQKEGDEIVVRVKDTGIGIAPGMLALIFEPFVQSERVQEHSPQGGLGIGLTLVRSLVQMHGGSVQAFSEGPGKGSEFVMRLPVLHNKPSRQGPASEELRPVSARRKRNILIVDDNVDAAESLALLLRLDGHEVRVEHDGPAALASIDAAPPDLVFLDIGMPVMNGYEVAQRLRQNPLLQNLRLVAMTGWGQEEDRRRSQEAGFDQHLVKPVDPEALRRLLEL